MTTEQLKSRVMTFSIYRFDPDKDQKPSMHDYQLDIETIKGKMLLNAIEAIKEKIQKLVFVVLALKVFVVPME